MKEEGNIASSDLPVSCWLCPLCPMVYKIRYHFDHHLQRVHQMQPEEVSSTWRVNITEEEFFEKQYNFSYNGSKIAKKQEAEEDESLGADSIKKKSTKSKWDKGSFSTNYSCKFCENQFKKDVDLIIHLKLVHGEKAKELIGQAIGEISEFKLDGCLYQCTICENIFNISTSFLRHVRDMHKMTLKEYHNVHGNGEIVTNFFICKLCSKSIKHTRNIITAHMKLVHQISWKEYLTRAHQQSSPEDPLSMTLQVSVGLLPPVVLFECSLCGSKVKIKKQHLERIHNIDEDVYAAFLGKDQSGGLAEISEAVTCKICKRMSMDLPRHLKMSHKTISEEEYDLVSPSEEVRLDSLSLQCYFRCKEMFLKEIDLLVHIKLKHSEEEFEEISKAKSIAMEQGATKRPGSSIWCEMCDSTLMGRSSFWLHITRKHKMPFKDYEAEFGKVNTDSDPFKCDLCSKQLKRDRSSINTHLKGIHNITWPQYLASIDGIKSGTISPPPPPKKVQCKLCNSSVKLLKSHLKFTHNMTQNDYKKIDVNDVKKEGIEVFPFRQQNTEATNIVKQEKELNQPPSQMNNIFKSATCKKALLKLDIKNKSLKSCNVCQLSFPARKSFIEHLQVVHGMKFKLKSGESLPPPTPTVLKLL